MRDYLFDELVGDLNEYGEATLECYDVDGDGALNRSEFDTFIMHTLDSRRRPCPSIRPPQELSEAEKAQILAWINAETNVTGRTRYFEKIYSSAPTTFERYEFYQALYENSWEYDLDYVVIGRSKADGSVFGSFGSLPWSSYLQYYDVLPYNSDYLFYFNLNSSTMWKNTTNSQDYFRVNTQYWENPGWERDLINFAFNDELIFRTCNWEKRTTVCARYFNMTTFDSNSAYSAGEKNVELSSFEVYIAHPL